MVLRCALLDQAASGVVGIGFAGFVDGLAFIVVDEGVCLIGFAVGDTFQSGLFGVVVIGFIRHGIRWGLGLGAVFLNTVGAVVAWYSSLQPLSLCFVLG